MPQRLMGLVPLLLLVTLSACQQIEPEAAQPAAHELPDGFTLLEEVGASDDGIVIPYRKYRMDNGLTVVLHEDNSDPLVHVDVTYHVGSGREEVGKSGFAHFFEHMMFQGSENIADEEHFRVISESGGTMNGSTSRDRTNYYQTVPSNQLEKVLWLESDRMGYFLDAVTQEKFEVQRDTVKNERGQSYDNRPYGRLIERVSEALYPEGHPYSWMPIGYIEDLNRVNVNDLKKFFLRWYGPNNATLTIGGRMDTEQTLQWIAKYFGPIPAGPAVDKPIKPEVSLSEDRYVSMEDKVAIPLLYMAFPTVHHFHPDEAPLDVLMFILGQGETSLLYKNMVKNGLAVQAGANHSCSELSCTFTILALPNPATGTTLTDIEKVARDSLEEFEERGVLEDDLTRVKMNIVSGKIYGLESVAGKVSQLAYYETFFDNPNLTAEDVARYENVTAEDVMRVYEKYVYGQPSVIKSIVPMGQLAQVAAPDTWERQPRQLPDYELTEASDLEMRIAEATFDRGVEPPAGDNPSVVLPAIWREELENGVKILGALNAETPTAAIQLRIDVGQRNEPLEQLGLAAMTASMLNESTQKSSNEELSNRLQKLGSSVSFSSGNNTTILSIRSLTRSLDETISIAAEMLLLPKFDESDFERLKAQYLQGIEARKKDASAVATEAFQLLLFGRENTFAYANNGLSETISSITLDDVKAFYETHYSPRIASIVAVSDLPQADVMEKLKVFEGWQGVDVSAPPLKPFPDLGKTQIYLIDKPGAPQSEIRIGKRAMPYDATGEQFRSTLMNFALGGNFNSRINQNLREEKGYTYGARSSFVGDREFGYFTASAAVRTDSTLDSIVQFEDEIRSYYGTGPNETEVLFTRNSIGQRDARQFETPSQKLNFLSRIVVYDLDDDFVNRQNALLSSIGNDELAALAKKHLRFDDMVILVVGDKQTIKPDLEELGYEIVELDAAGLPVST